MSLPSVLQLLALPLPHPLRRFSGGLPALISKSVRTYLRIGLALPIPFYHCVYANHCVQIFDPDVIPLRTQSSINKKGSRRRPAGHC